MFLNLILNGMKNGFQSLGQHRDLKCQSRILTEKVLLWVLQVLSDCVFVVTLDRFICVVWREGSCSIPRVGKGIVS